MWRAEIADTAATLAMRAQMAGEYASLRDDFGLTRTLRLMTIEMRHVLSLCADLDEQKTHQRERQQATARPPMREEKAGRAAEWV
ncbi:hypothetical protein [Methylobacterium planeticum]|uniref:Uncharacterized protein n=1 Tax=Methylobacterium planeticum TaxID=2615211 RepID=A0A6N6MP03_9HYPH|nr:hypothetical protein [Methylobacterium planeticum]KAB1072174.1 hypothetical protein F6X51_17280 [Methylobacterium planeticum]